MADSGRTQRLTHGVFSGEIITHLRGQRLNATIIRNVFTQPTSCRSETKGRRALVGGKGCKVGCQASTLVNFPDSVPSSIVSRASLAFPT